MDADEIRRSGVVELAAALEAGRTTSVRLVEVYLEAADRLDRTIGTYIRRFDEQALARFMQDRVPGFRPPLKVEQFKGGQSNPTFRLSTPSRDYVLRRKPLGPLRRTRVDDAHSVATASPLQRLRVEHADQTGPQQRNGSHEVLSRDAVAQ